MKIQGNLQTPLLTDYALTNMENGHFKLRMRELEGQRKADESGRVMKGKLRG